MRVRHHTSLGRVNFCWSGMLSRRAVLTAAVGICNVCHEACAVSYMTFRTQKAYQVTHDPCANMFN